MLAASPWVSQPLRSSLILVALATGTANLGCCLCDNPFDQQYAAYGGRKPRVDMVRGRVNSAFRDAANPPLAESFGPENYYEDGMDDAYEMSAPDSQEQPFQLREPTPYGEQQFDMQPYEEVPYQQAPPVPQPGEAEPPAEAELPDYESYDIGPLPDLEMDEAPPERPAEQPTPAEPVEPAPREPDTLPPAESQPPPDEPSPSDLDLLLQDYSDG